SFNPMPQARSYWSALFLACGIGLKQEKLDGVEHVPADCRGFVPGRIWRPFVIRYQGARYAESLWTVHQ
ncbi:MAG: hypothetical protein KDA81_14740, partial [Planctomycetaceae bacterium]|nr:hypothetical protein [Planctomycetaceae bacterium]